MSEEKSMGPLYAALAKAQAQMQSAKKDSVNPHFRAKYADLAAVWEACRKALTDNGLAVVQMSAPAAEGVRVITVLGHSSGLELRDDPPVYPLAQRTPQAIGSAITYARRYGLAAMVGVAPDEDDDGNEASKTTAPPQRSTPRTAAEMTQALKASVEATRLPPSPTPIERKRRLQIQADDGSEPPPHTDADAVGVPR